MPDRSNILLDLFDGTRRPVSPGFKTYVTVVDGHQEVFSRDYQTASAIRFIVPFYDNFGDNYRVIATASGHHTAAFFPIRVRPGRSSRVALLLLPKENRYRFAEWQSLEPDVASFFSRAIGLRRARDLYNDLLDGDDLRQDILAATHNFIAALESTLLGDRNLFSYFDRLIWPDEDPSLQLHRDRFFAYVDRQLLDDLRQARRYRTWEDAPSILHPGATCSFKQTAFDEANLQLTFHENDPRTPSGMLRVEVDIDYYRDLISHFLLEILPNTLRKDKTSPKVAGMLRWIATRNHGAPDFNPRYIIESVDTSG